MPFVGDFGRFSWNSLGFPTVLEALYMCACYKHWDYLILQEGGLKWDSCRAGAITFLFDAQFKYFLARLKSIQKGFGLCKNEPKNMQRAD